MHMADALISPAVGGTLLACSAGVVAYSARKVQKELEDKKIPLMGVMGAFVFAAQMINFTIPGTGSSGHIGGGMLLAILLGPFAGFLTMASVLLIQALFFADGGLLAYGCNLINMGFFTCFLAYPLIYRTITYKKATRGRLILASILSVVVALQLGAFSVVLETQASGKTELPFLQFVLFMQPIHLAIGLIEGFITAAIIVFLHQARPDLVGASGEGSRWSHRKVMIFFIILALLLGGFVSWFASANPDGLEWSIQKLTGFGELKSQDSLHGTLADVQEKTAIMPDYGFKENSNSPSANTRTGTSVAGLTGSLMTLGLVAAITILLILLKRRKKPV